MNKEAQQEQTIDSSAELTPETDATTVTTNASASEQSTSTVTSIAEDNSPEVLEPPPASESVSGPAATHETVASAEETEPATMQLTIANLEQQLAEKQQQLEALKSQYMRIAADFENFRKRSIKEKEETEYQAKRETLSGLLTAIDSFERARAQIKPANDGEMTIHRSYQGVYKQLVDGLKRIGVSAMRPEGELFDPNLHEAVYREPTSEHPEDTVMEQVLRGYLLGDRVLRHAMVKVAAPQEPVLLSEEEVTAEVDETPAEASTDE